MSAVMLKSLRVNYSVSLCIPFKGDSAAPPGEQGPDPRQDGLHPDRVPQAPPAMDLRLPWNGLAGSLSR